MKKAILFLGVAAVAILAGCTKSEMKVNNETKTFEGDKAYVVVKISDVGTSGTKATSPGYEYGSSDEYAINDVSFYFYGSDGVFVAEAEATPTGAKHDGTDPVESEDPVEFDANTVITLQGLSSKEYPTWVVTVLNKPSGFKTPSTLEEFAEKLAGGIKVDSYYTMSTSSYVGSDNGYDDAYWFATPVIPENFSLEALTPTDSYPYYQDADGSDVEPINIYVERLAAKVTLDVSSSLTSVGTDGTYIYKISNEVYDPENPDPDQPTDLYVKINGWALNATAKDSYVVKAIENTTTWTNDYFYPTISDSYAIAYTGDPDDRNFGNEWNSATDHRSFWGKSWNYGIILTDGYPTTSKGYDDDGQDVLNDYLDYTSLLEGNLNDLGEYLYCGENTNTASYTTSSTPAVIYDKESSAITSILVSATLCKDADGTPVVDPDDVTTDNFWVLVDNVLYSETDYLNYALEHLATYAEYYTKETVTVTDENKNDYPDNELGDEVDVYTGIDNSYVELVDDYDGYVHVALKEEYANTDFYVFDEDGNVNDPAYSATDVNNALKTSFNDTYGSGANAYYGGAMYYNIPIEHLNNDYVEKYYDSEGDVQERILEANYGVVRNHIYKVTIDGVTGLGRGIYNPDEVIIPQPEVKTYSLTAEIHILSWKIVSQNTTL